MRKDEEKAIEQAVDSIEEAEDAAPEATEATETGLEPTAEKNEKTHHRRKLVITAVIVAIVMGTLLGIPFTRYGLLGLFVTKSVALTVVDANSGKPVSAAKVSLGRFDVETDAKGVARVDSVAVGEHQLVVEKKNYTTKTTTHTVPVLMPEKDTTIKIVALGRSASFSVLNSLTGKPVKGAMIAIEGTSALSDDAGKASVVLPVKADVQTGTVKADGYNPYEISITMKAGEDPMVEVKLVPAGKVYFLSKRTGKIDVMSANLDGSAPTVVLSASGRESDTETSLIASPSWNHLMLISRRDATWPKLYMITANTGKLTTVDEAEAGYDPIGWVGEKFYYKATNYKQNPWQNGTESLVSYNAETDQRKVVDSSVGIGTSYYDMAAQHISQAFVAEGKVVYTKYWQYSQAYADKNRAASVMAVVADGDLKTTVKDIPQQGDTYVDTVLQKPGVVMIRIGKADNTKAFYRYAAGRLANAESDDVAFYNSRLSYLMSPNGEKALWTEQRDGRNVVFTAGRDLTNGNQLSTGEYGAYGWVTNDYVLYGKNQSELYIAPVGVQLDGKHKITDYHKAYAYPGYGWGYGGTAY